eukprot:gene8886-biopygen21183
MCSQNTAFFEHDFTEPAHPLGETATPASGPRPVRVRFFKFYRASRVRSASGPRSLPFLPGESKCSLPCARPVRVELEAVPPARQKSNRGVRHKGDGGGKWPSMGETAEGTAVLETRRWAGLSAWKNTKMQRNGWEGIRGMHAAISPRPGQG